MEEEKRFRRKTFSFDEVEKMKQLEADGKTRKEISLEMGCSSAAVTKRLGAVRTYAGKRVKVA